MQHNTTILQKIKGCASQNLWITPAVSSFVQPARVNVCVCVSLPMFWSLEVVDLP